MGDLIHAEAIDPRIIPYAGNVDWAQIDRVQRITKEGTLNREPYYELGRENKVDFKHNNPTVRYSMEQIEYGSLEFWQKLANVGASDTDIELSDFSTKFLDMTTYKTDGSGTFKQTVWLPKLRLAGFNINIADPNAMIMRTFEFNGEDYKWLQGANKYLIFGKATVASGESTKNITLNDPIPVEDPNNSGVYLLRVWRTSSSVTTDLVETTDYTYNSGTNVLSITGNTVGDIVKYIYSSGSYIGGSDTFTNNDVDLGHTQAQYVTITIGVGNVLYRLQNVGMDVALDRLDVFEIGNDEVVKTSIRNETVRINFGRLQDDLTIEEVLMGVASDWGIIDIRSFLDNLTLRVKIFSDETKTTFKIGYKITGISADAVSEELPVNDHATQNNTIVSDNFLVSSVEATIDA